MNAKLTIHDKTCTDCERGIIHHNNDPRGFDFCDCPRGDARYREAVDNATEAAIGWVEEDGLFGGGGM